MAKENVEAPIPGKVISVDVKVGDEVQEGDIICYVESMKMENPIVSSAAGKVTELKVSEGDVVETGNVLAVIES